MAFTVKLIFGQIRFQKRVPSSVQGNAKAVKPFADSVGCSHPKKPRKSRSIHLDCGIMETPGQLTSQEIYVLDIPKPDAATVIQVSVNAEQVKTNRIRKILLTQTDTVTNIYLYYDNTDYGPRIPLDYTCSNHPDAFVFNIYDDRKQLNCLVLSIPSAEIDLTAHTLPVQDLENNQLITIDLQTGIAT